MFIVFMFAQVVRIGGDCAYVRLILTQSHVRLILVESMPHTVRYTGRRLFFF